jgi:hypothetical protein
MKKNTLKRLCVALLTVCMFAFMPIVAMAADEVTATISTTSGGSSTITHTRGNTNATYKITYAATFKLDAGTAELIADYPNSWRINRTSFIVTFNFPNGVVMDSAVPELSSKFFEIDKSSIESTSTSYSVTCKLKSGWASGYDTEGLRKALTDTDATIRVGATITGANVEKLLGNNSSAIITSQGQLAVRAPEVEGSRLYDFIFNANDAQLTLVAAGEAVNVPAGGAAVTTTITANPVVNPDVSKVSDWLNTKSQTAYMSGYANGTFGVEMSITRAEVAQIFYNLLNDKSVTVTTGFSDVADDAWYAKAVNTLASLGIVNGVNGGTFAPNAAITRAEFAAIAARFAAENTANAANFSDVSASHWAYKYIATAYSYGWVNGVGDGAFAPGRNITRAEAATMVNRMLGRVADKTAIDGGAAKTFSDVKSNHWAWYDIAVATTEGVFTVAE